MRFLGRLVGGNSVHRYGQTVGNLILAVLRLGR